MTAGADLPTGGLAPAALPRELAGAIPADAVRASGPQLLLGGTLGLLNEGGEGPTVPYPYIGGD